MAVFQGKTDSAEHGFLVHPSFSGWHDWRSLAMWQCSMSIIPTSCSTKILRNIPLSHDYKRNKCTYSWGEEVEVVSPWPWKMKHNGYEPNLLCVWPPLMSLEESESSTDNRRGGIPFSNIIYNMMLGLQKQTYYKYISSHNLKSFSDTPTFC